MSFISFAIIWGFHILNCFNAKHLLNVQTALGKEIGSNVVIQRHASRKALHTFIHAWTESIVEHAGVWTMDGCIAWILFTLHNVHQQQRQAINHSATQPCRAMRPPIRSRRCFSKEIIFFIADDLWPQRRRPSQSCYRAGSISQFQVRYINRIFTKHHILKLSSLMTLYTHVGSL